VHNKFTFTSRSNKAVSDGAISFFLDHHVRTRVAKVSYGTDFSVPYNRSDPEHLKRPASKFINADGSPFISGVFNVVLPKVKSPPYALCLSF